MLSPGDENKTLAQSSVGNLVPVPLVAPSHCKQPPWPVQILLRDEDHGRFAILQVGRGMGPRALEEYLKTVQQEDRRDGQQVSRLFGASHHRGPNPGAEEEHPVLVNPFYSAYSQSLVLVMASKRYLQDLRGPEYEQSLPNSSWRSEAAVQMTVQCLVEGTVSTEMTLYDKDTSRYRHCNTHVTPMETVPSNGLGSMTLVQLRNGTAFTGDGPSTPTAPPPTTVRPRQFRLHLDEAGYPILGKAQGARSFRGEALCMAMVQLAFTIVPPTDESSQAVPPSKPQRVIAQIDPPAKFRVLMDKEKQFWMARRINDDPSVPTNADPSADLVPAAYRKGTTTFCGLEFFVSPAVMIPRSGSEALVEKVAQYRESSPGDNKDISVLDLGTGSGCLLISILRQLPNHARGTGIDHSAKALAVAKQNARNLGVEKRCQLIEGSFDSLIVLQSHGQFDVVVCNPPYHTKGGRKRLDISVSLHEPDEALFVEPSDMLVHYRNVVHGLVQHQLLRHGSLLVFEVFKENAAAVSQLMSEAGFDEVEIGKDARGIVRTASAMYNPGDGK